MKKSFMKGNSSIYLFIVVLIVILSCDPSNFEFPAHQAEIYMPLIDVKLGLDDLILADTSDILQEDSTGLVSIIYSMSETKTFEEVFVFDDQLIDFTLPGIPSEIPGFSVEIPIHAELLGIDTGFYSVFPSATYEHEEVVDIDEFNQAEFKSGLLELELSNNLPFTIRAGATIELINEGETNPILEFSLEENLAPKAHYIFEEVNLSDKTLTGSFTLRLAELSTAGASEIQIDSEDKLDFKLSFKSIAFKRASFSIFNLDLPSFTLDLPISSSAGSLVQRVRLDDGIFTIEIPELNSALRLKINFLSAYQNGNPVHVILGGNETSISLENLEIDLSTKSPAYNILPIEIELMFDEAADEIAIEFEKPLDAKIELKNFDFDNLYGYLGTSTSVLENSESLDFYRRIVSGTLAFYDPQLQISVLNGVGASARFYDDGEGLYIRGSNELVYGDKIVDIGNSFDGFTIKASPLFGTTEISTLFIDRSTEPDFGEFLSLFPNSMEMRIPVKLGTDSINFDQFIEDDGELSVRVDLNLPLHLAADRFIITDTADLSLRFDAEKFKIRSGIFSAKAESYFPIELNIQNYFLNGNMEIIDSLFDEVKILEPAKIDANGNITEPFLAEYIIEIDLEQMERLQNTKYAVSTVFIQTPDSKFVRLLSSYNLLYQLTGELVTDIDMNQ